MGNALAGFLLRVSQGSASSLATSEAPKQEAPTPQTPSSLPTSSIASPTFFFNELAPECEDFLSECLIKAPSLKRGTTEEQGQAAEPSEDPSSNDNKMLPYQRLRQVVETIKASPLTARLSDQSPALSRSLQHSVQASPYTAEAQPYYAGESAADQIRTKPTASESLAGSGAADQKPPFSFSSPLPPTSSPTPPELSESFRELASRTKLLPHSPLAPTLTPTTLLALGEKLPEEELANEISDCSFPPLEPLAEKISPVSLSPMGTLFAFACLTRFIRSCLASTEQQNRDCIRFIEGREAIW